GNPWIRLTRTANRFQGYHAADAGGMPDVWVLHADTGDVPGTPSKLLVGLMDTSHNNGVLAQAKFKKFMISPDETTLHGPNAVLIQNLGDGNVKVTWGKLNGHCGRLQGTSELKNNPLDTIWVDVSSGGPPLTLPIGTFQFFRTIDP